MKKTRSARFVEEEQPFIYLALMTTFITILRIALPTVRDTLQLHHVSEVFFFNFMHEVKIFKDSVWIRKTK